MFGIASLEDKTMSDWRDRVARVEDRLDKIEADIKEIKRNAIFALVETPELPAAALPDDEPYDSEEFPDGDYKPEK